MKNSNKMMMILASAALLASCGGSSAKTGEAYALCHGGSYVAGATVTVDGGKATAATLGEVCLPSYITAGEDVEADKKVVGNVTSHGTTSEVAYYKEVKFGSYTLTATVDAEGALSYTGADWTKGEVCEAYYKAVMENSVEACGDKTIMTKAALSKDENGYGGANFNWKANRDATVDAYIKYGSEACLAATQTEVTEGETTKKYWTVGEEKTGATWTDFNQVKEGYLSYIAVLTAAEANAK